MAEVRDTRWLDVINYIDGTGEQEAAQLQREESLRKRAYHQLIDEHCDGRKLIKIRELAQKSQEREEVNRNVRVGLVSRRNNNCFVRIKEENASTTSSNTAKIINGSSDILDRKQSQRQRTPSSSSLTRRKSERRLSRVTFSCRIE